MAGKTLNLQRVRKSDAKLLLSYACDTINMMNTMTAMTIPLTQIARREADEITFTGVQAAATGPRQVLLGSPLELLLGSLAATLSGTELGQASFHNR